MEFDTQLDNPVWAALTGPQAALGVVRGGAARFHAEFCPFASVVDAADDDAWRDLRRLVPSDETIALPGMQPQDVPRGWAVVETIPCHQLVAGGGGGGDRARPSAAAKVEALTPEDVPSMLALVDETERGPFRERTVEMGPYLGIRSPDPSRRLAAMSGVRLRTGSWHEISAVCTHPDFRGRGYAGTLVEGVSRLVDSAHGRPFLHVRIGNPAERLYEALGFTVRRDIDFVIVRPS